MTTSSALTPAEFAKLRSLPPADAIAWMRGRGQLTETYSWQDLWQREHAQQFTVSRLARVDLLDALRDGLTKSVAGDLTRKDWMRDAEKLLADAGWWGVKAVTDPVTGEKVMTRFDPARLKLIYDTNTRQAYAAGQWQRIQRTKRALPYLRYVTKRDDRVRPLHALWDNVTLPVDDPFWQTHFPPNGYRCRCTVIQVTQAEYDRGETPRGPALKKQRPEVVTSEFVNRRTGEVTDVPAGIDPGFDFNVGDSREALLTNLVQRKLASLSAPMRAAAQAAGLSPAPLRRLGGTGTTATAWTDPKTGQVRVYLNDLPEQRGAKVWIEPLERPDSSGADYTVKVTADNLTRVEVSNLANAAERFLVQLAGRRVKLLAELLLLLGA